MLTNFAKDALVILNMFSLAKAHFVGFLLGGRISLLIAV
jgi:pimeloyl-ACP methyl ester carboxylesterase